MFLRIFSRPNRYDAWVSASPQLSFLLDCFGIDRIAQSVKPVSVFRATNPIEELQNVAAYLQTNQGSVEKTFALRISDEDCQCAGIKVDSEARGETGLHLIDARHANLTGTPEAFIQLSVRIVGKIWEGEDRLRVFPSHQIIGEMAVLARLEENAIDPHARSRCHRVLEREADRFAYSGDGCVQITGRLNDNKGEFPVCAVRQLPARDNAHGRAD